MRAAILAVGSGLLLAGCAQEPPVPDYRPVVVVTNDFCDTMQATLPAGRDKDASRQAGKPTWDVTDTSPTIQDARRVGAVVDSRCGPSAKPSSATK